MLIKRVNWTYRSQKIVNITKILEASSLEPSSELDLTDVTVSEVKKFFILRQPKT